MLPFLQSICIDDHWLLRNATSSLSYLLFKNGYLDMNTGNFYKTFNPEIVFMARLTMKYKRLNAEGLDYMMDVKRRFFDIPLGQEVGDFFLLQLSRALAGDVRKKIMFGIGPANNGKSTFIEAFYDIKTDEAANMHGSCCFNTNDSFFPTN